MLIGWRLVLSKLFIIPQRYVMAIMCLLAKANAFTMRVCLNLAITQMVLKRSHTDKMFTDPDACPDVYHLNTTKISVLSSDNRFSPTFEWSEATQGLLLSSFYYGYILTNLPGGMYAERYGGKWILGFGMLITAFCTLATPFVVTWGGAKALFALRVVEGMAEGPVMPGLMVLLSRWSPASERGRMGAIVFGGSQIGNIFGTVLSGLIMHYGRWENVFYLFGSIAVLWFVFWALLVYSTPDSHPFISDEEREYLNCNVEALKGKKQLAPVPWKAILRSVPLWAIIIAGIGHDWGYFTMVTDLPKYMSNVLKFNIKSTGYLSALPYIFMWISSFIYGILCDFIIRKGYLGISSTRKLYTTIASTGPGIFIILASYSGCDTKLAVGSFILAMTLMGAYYSGMKVNALDISPNYSGTTSALVNGIAAIAGIISPYLIGLLTPDSTLKQWREAFWVCFGVLFVTNVVYIVFAKGTQQWWDDVDKYGYPADWKHGPLPKLRKDEESDNTKDINKDIKYYLKLLFLTTRLA